MKRNIKYLLFLNLQTMITCFAIYFDQSHECFYVKMLWKDELGGVRGPLLLGVQENKQTREEQNNRIRTIARLVSVCLVPRASCL